LSQLYKCIKKEKLIGILDKLSLSLLST